MTRIILKANISPDLGDPFTGEFKEEPSHIFKSSLGIYQRINQIKHPTHLDQKLKKAAKATFIQAAKLFRQQAAREYLIGIQSTEDGYEVKVEKGKGFDCTFIHYIGSMTPNFPDEIKDPPKIVISSLEEPFSFCSYLQNAYSFLAAQDRG